MSPQQHASTRTYRYPATVTGFLTPPVTWAIYFLFIYAVHGLVCVGELRGSIAGVDALAAIIFIATVVALAIHAGVGFWGFRIWRKIKSASDESEEGHLSGQAHFLAYAAALNAGLFGLATIWIGLPTLILQPCS